MVDEVVVDDVVVVDVVVVVEVVVVDVVVVVGAVVVVVGAVVVVAGPLDTTMVTVAPSSALPPAPGTVRMTRPAATALLGSCSIRVWKPSWVSRLAAAVDV